MEKRTFVFHVLLLLVLLSFSACGSRQICEPAPQDTRSPFPALSQSLKVDVFLDGTVSMKGFIVPGTATRYQRTLPLLENSVERGWPDRQIAFYKFGTTVAELPEREYLKAQQTGFYAGNVLSRDTLIQNVIQQAAPDKLTVVVTDLFQKDVDVNLLTNQIKEKYIKQGLAVGVLGIKSEFGGRIYDVGPNNYAFDYRSDDSNAATFRPFYVLAFGGHADVNRYFDEMFKGGLRQMPETQAVIISQHLTSKPASFEDAVITDIAKLQQVSGLLPPDVADRRVEQFRISDASVPQASFTAKLKYNALDYRMPLESPALETEVEGYMCGAAGGEGADTQRLVLNEDVERAFAVKEAALNEATIDLKAEVTPAFLPAAGIYCFKVTLRPKEFKNPAWFKDWNMDVGQVEVWKRSPRDFNGATTFNLETFLTNLWATTRQQHRPHVAEFYCYVRKD